MITCKVRVDGLGTTHIEVSEFSTDSLEKEVYGFRYKNHEIVPATYRSYIRKTKRHKFSLVSIFGATDSRQNTLKSLPYFAERIRTSAYTAFVETLKQ